MNHETDDEQTTKGDDRPVARLAAAIAAAQAVAREQEDVAEIEIGPATEPPKGEPGQPDRVDDRIAADTGGPEDPGETGDGSVPEARQPVTRRLWPVYAIMAVLILAVPSLIVVGYRLVQGSTTGDVLSGTAGPEDPGYTALVEPTPVALVLQVDDSNHPETLSMLSLSGAGNQGGVAVAMPVNTRLSGEPLGFKTFDSVVAAGSPRTAGTTIGKELGLGFTEVIEVSDADLTRFVEPVSPLTIDNPDEVTAPDGVTFAKGPQELSAEEVPQYLAAQDASPSPDTHMKRQGLVWSAWVQAIADAGGGPDTVPGENEAGLGRYLLGLAAGSLSTAALPTLPDDELDGQPTVKVDPDLERLLIANAVPFAVGAAPGERTTVRLLNGVEPKPAPPSVIQRLNYGGAQINTAGNAERFGIETTTVTYAEPKYRTSARRLAEALGVKRIERVDAADGPDSVTIVLGADLVDPPPKRLTTESVGR